MSTTRPCAGKPCSHGAARFRVAWPLVVLLLLLSPFAGFIRPATVRATHTNIKFPFAAGATWRVMQGYNGSSHQNTSSTWQYYYSLDLVRDDGNTVGQRVLSPVNGTIRWIDEDYGGMSIYLGDGYAFAYFHTVLAPGLAAGQTVTQGQYLGTLAPAGVAGAGSTPHIHVTLWTTNDGGNWDRHAVPFTDEHDIDGYDFPDVGGSNQHRGKAVVSSNVEIAGGAAGSAPGVPSLVSPATGTTYTTSPKTTTLSWNAVSSATQYQVVINDGAITSDWQSGTSWSTPSLGNGQYAWQVRARNANGTSNLSAKWVFWIDPGSSTTPTPTRTPTPSGTVTPAPLAVGLSDSSDRVGTTITVNGTGYGANEPVRLYWDSISSAGEIYRTTANGSGAWSVPISIPDAVGGNHKITGRGMTTDKRANATFKVTSYLNRTPYQGPPGTTINLTVQGFGANETVKVSFDSQTGPVLKNVTTNDKGTGSTTFPLPEASNGWHDYVGVGQTSGLTAWGALYIERSLTASPTSGAPGTTINVSAKGFPASQSITIAWNKVAGSAGTNVCTGSTSSKGSYSCSFAIPQVGAGSYPLGATTTGGATATVNIGVSGPAAVSISPGSGPVGGNVSISVGGFGANETVSLSWDNSTSVWQSRQTDANGAFQFPALAPSLSVGSHTLKAKGASSGKTASTSFSVTAGSPGNTSMIGPGTFAVTATEEGLVGETTSNGHRIQLGDRFVALPACTESSCPSLTPGGSRYVAACGDNCYVKVTNPANNKCSVGPVWDVGPWFTNDNWWDPTNQRNLNNLSTTKNVLPQGYTGVDAARDGLDVGYGVSNGIGISNVGYQVGNRAAIDLGDGTWTDIGFRRGDGIGEVVVTILWLTGEDHAAAARACGQGSGSATPTATPTPSGTPSTTRSLSLSPSRGASGTTTNLTGTGFRAGENVKIHFESTKNPAMASLKADGNGNISGTITIPETVAGYHLIAAKGETSGLTASKSFKVIPTLSRSPVKGVAGTTIQVAAKGFGANESVELRWDDENGAVLATLTTDGKGTGSGSFAIPEASAGSHDYTGLGLTSKVRAWSAVQVINLATASVTLSPSSGSPRTSLTATGTKFTANEVVDFFWDNATTSAGNATANSQGTARITLKVPLMPVGAHKVTMKGRTSGAYGTATYTVVQSLSLSPTSGPGGTKVTAKGRGWAAGAKVNVYWNRTSTRSGVRVCTVIASSTGSFTCSFAVPNSPSARYPVVGVSGSRTASQDFRITTASTASTDQTDTTPTPTSTPTARTLSLSPRSGAAGSEVGVTGTGFRPGETVNLYFESTRTDPLTSATADEIGSISASIVIPAGDLGYHLIAAKGTASGLTASKSFKITETVPAQTAVEEGEATETPVPESADVETAEEEPTATETAESESTEAEAPVDEPEPTETPTEETVPTEEPTEEPSPTDEPSPTEETTPEPTPEPEPRELVFLPVADTSVNATNPDAPQAPEEAGALAAGGEDGAVAFITFQIEGIAAGTVVNAQLILTDIGEASGGTGAIGTLGEVWVDEAGWTYATAPIWDGAPAVAADGTGAEVWLDPWVETVVDVTGTVAADGTITFVISGTPDATLLIGSRESGAPARLVVTVVDEVGEE